MKSVLMSVKPKWCALIANGKKTVEIRKTFSETVFRNKTREQSPDHRHCENKR